MAEENDYKKYEDPEELRREIQVRITKLDELERAISGEKCKSKDPSFPQIHLAAYDFGAAKFHMFREGKKLPSVLPQKTVRLACMLHRQIHILH